MTPRQKRRFENLIADCLNAGFLCGDWKDTPGGQPYDVVWRQAQQKQARLLQAIDRAIKQEARHAEVV